MGGHRCIFAFLKQYNFTKFYADFFRVQTLVVSGWAASVLWFDKLTMRSKPLKTLNLILGLSKDEAQIQAFSAAC
jgi:hypothetical protein